MSVLVWAWTASVLRYWVCVPFAMYPILPWPRQDISSLSWKHLAENYLLPVQDMRPFLALSGSRVTFPTSGCPAATRPTKHLPPSLNPACSLWTHGNRGCRDSRENPPWQSGQAAWTGCATCFSLLPALWPPVLPGTPPALWPPNPFSKNFEIKGLLPVTWDSFIQLHRSPFWERWRYLRC